MSLTGSRRDQEERGGARPSTHRVPGEIKRREVVLGPQVIPEKIMSREMEELGCERRCNGHRPCDSALAQQLKQRSTLVAAQWRGDTALTLPLFWRRSTASSVSRVGTRGRPFSLSPPSPPPPPTPTPVSNNKDYKCIYNLC